jgi:hypothetical protein
VSGFEGSLGMSYRAQLFDEVVYGTPLITEPGAVATALNHRGHATEGLEVRVAPDPRE